MCGVVWLRSGRLAAALLLTLFTVGCTRTGGALARDTRDALQAVAGGLAAEYRQLPPELGRAAVYRLELRVADGLDEVQGSLRVSYTNAGDRALESVRLFVFPNLIPGALTILSASAGGRAVEPAFPLGPHLVELALPAPLPPGERTEVGLEYTLRVPAGTDGVYGALARNTGVLSLASACPVIPARQAWAEPPPVPYGDFLAGEAAFFLARVSLPAGWTLVAPGVVRERSAADGRTEATVALGPARDLYLAAVQDYLRRERRAEGVQVVSLAPRGSEAGAELVAEAAAASLRSFRRRFGAYPYTRLTFVAAPFASYGLEFPGIVLLASRLYDLAGSERGVPHRVLLESTVAHEAAHQWFYGLVGSDPLQEPWLDEAPAQYATWLYYRDRYGEGAAAGFFASFAQRWDRVRREAIPIGLPVRSYTPLQYGAIVYGRAPLFLNALSERLGEETFDRLLAEYVRRWRWRLASGSDFLALAGELCGCELEDLIRSWGVRP